MRLDGHLSLNGLFAYSFSAETIEKTCEKCQCKLATITHRLVKPPKVLVLHLKRFRVNATGTSYDKIVDIVQIDTRLDISPFAAFSKKPPHTEPEGAAEADVQPKEAAETDDTAASIPSTSSPSRKRKREDQKADGKEGNARKKAKTDDELLKEAITASEQSFKAEQERYLSAVSTVTTTEKTQSTKSTKETKVGKDYSYVLCCSVVHLGSTASGGHYICDAFDFKNKQWTSYNDSVSTKILRSRVIAKDRAKGGYLYFYIPTP
eukprot:TRINITY_DN8316_c0_g1_i1.p1 TRINITY_DN8316_c0_g1~~TRINITY_DN8316_c0_g1_i1.p1  ORF type:complete len:301 (-),score=60.95 TRINITY_DN8316_c0_g1_i1:786-1577(-)